MEILGAPDIGIAMANAAAMLRFYREGLGLTVDEQPRRSAHGGDYRLIFLHEPDRNWLELMELDASIRRRTRDSHQGGAKTADRVIASPRNRSGNARLARYCYSFTSSTARAVLRRMDLNAASSRGSSGRYCRSPASFSGSQT